MTKRKAAAKATVKIPEGWPIIGKVSAVFTAMGVAVALVIGIFDLKNRLVGVDEELTVTVSDETREAKDYGVTQVDLLNGTAFRFGPFETDFILANRSSQPISLLQIEDYVKDGRKMLPTMRSLRMLVDGSSAELPVNLGAGEAVKLTIVASVDSFQDEAIAKACMREDFVGYQDCAYKHGIRNVFDFMTPAILRFRTANATVIDVQYNPLGTMLVTTGSRIKRDPLNAPLPQIILDGSEGMR